MLSYIQTTHYNSLQNKLSNNVEELINYQKPMKITYLIIRKLELENLVKNPISESQE
jgi:hypothetical protein